MAIDSELKITNLAWNENLSNPNSQMFIELKEHLENDLTVTFCKDTHCHVEVTGFTEGSVIVHFRISQMVQSDTLSSLAGILADMQNAIAENEGVGNFAVSANSVIISKI